jgi:hypothetical protein
VKLEVKNQPIDLQTAIKRAKDWLNESRSFFSAHVTKNGTGYRFMQLEPTMAAEDLILIRELLKRAIQDIESHNRHVDWEHVDENQRFVKTKGSEIEGDFH